MWGLLKENGHLSLSAHGAQIGESFPQESSGLPPAPIPALLSRAKQLHSWTHTPISSEELDTFQAQLFLVRVRLPQPWVRWILWFVFPA